MLLPYIREREQVFKVGMKALIWSGIILTLTIIIDISILGSSVVGRAPFPLLTTMGKIDIQKFLQRLDVLSALILVIGSFFKYTIFYYITLLAATDVFQFKNHRQLILPIGSILLVFSLIIAPNISEHLKEGLEIVPFFLHLPFQVGIPLLLLIIHFLKSRYKKREQTITG